MKNKLHNKNIWLSYVSYPVTTAVYFERALRRTSHHITTIGPRLPEEYIERWQLQSMKLPILPLDIDTSLDPDMAQIMTKCPASEKPDLFIWIESAGGFLIKNLHALNCPKACYLIDSHLHLDSHLLLAKYFDYIFIAQREYLDEFRAIQPNSYWLPLACDPEIHTAQITNKKHEIGFVGGITPGSRREALLATLQSEQLLHFERCFWHEMAQLFAESKVVINNAVNHDLNMRFFEALASGSLLLSDMAEKSGQNELFVAGEDYVCYRDENIIETARFYLANDKLRDKIAARGNLLALNAHTYAHRVEDMLAVLFDGKIDTWSSQELRSRSLKGVPPFDENWRSKATPDSVPSRSFVIPVLDYSPASEYNILTLLRDLESVTGQVIVVFNDSKVAEELRNHPRIDHYIIMQCNVGVSRAWNIGLDVAEAPTVFILNADLHIQLETVDYMEKLLWSIENAAVVGPQGSFVNFELCCDYQYFDKGSFNQPVEVDAVSGFLFAVKRELFDNKTLKFEPAYSPCYFEEWDLGLQIKMAGLKSYIVPVTGYDHHWSGTIRALRTIPYLGREETAGEILLRNRELFLTKWRGIMHRFGLENLFTSLWLNHAITVLHQKIDSGDMTGAMMLATELEKWFSDNSQLKPVFRFLELHNLKLSTKEG